MTKNKPFIGRKDELIRLKSVYDRKTPNLAVIKGRRRIGKSRLITEFADQQKQTRFFSFTGLAPQDGITAQMQRDHFGKQLAHSLKISPLTFQDWTDAFNYLSLCLKEGDIVLFDEISWMGAKDPTFIPKLKAWWDVQKTRILLVLCGSVSTWIEDNIINSTAFFGRISLTLTLEALSIPESAELLRLLGLKTSPFDTYKFLSIVGGIPWYLEQIDPRITIDENIKNLCFRKDGLLFLEFDRLFHDLFNGKGLVYKNILQSLKEGMKTLSEIRENIGYAASGTLSEMISHLMTAGFIKEYRQWSIKTENPLKQSLYRICDPFIRFYLKVIEPNRSKVEDGFFEEVDIGVSSGFEAHMGLQMETLLLQNRSLLIKSIGIHPGECRWDGPYRQTKTVRTKGCQIDYLVQTRTQNLFLCEFKFKRRELGSEIIEEVQEKKERFSIPRGFAIVPVLFQLGGVSVAVYDRDYFYRIIDTADFLEKE
ncbi:MAG: hypothetical protein B7Y25_03435 [Alphaproteobacteria bacterium 16-39-46]|nr:MAG: hypothetical protein B7Y25_03435 [Alphaproteobacteria bacterium 16-39-46]OZA43328.1 MAG: hypothetical protein B7X84_03525 [Alphaproteobacteria bacterium 17-39-52]HQS83932.1 ATP-binding protein [Alphaproteobacteria bacterium]HQS93782.1 ATP-binding protein [Alphaproteobacteria bacterium]